MKVTQARQSRVLAVALAGIALLAITVILPSEAWLQALNGSEDSSFLQAAGVGPGGAMVLFLPCKIDGFWSNFRQVIPSLYLARKFNLAYVGQELFYKFQDNGHVSGVLGPQDIFDIIDRDHLERFTATATQEEFWGNVTAKSAAPDQFKYAAIANGVRCEGSLTRSNMERNSVRWLRRHKISKDQVLANKVRSKASQWELLRNASFEPPGSRFVLSATPRFDNMLKDYITPPLFRTIQDVPEFWRASFEMVRFAKPIRELQQRAKHLLGIAPDEPFIAVHIRRGATFAIGRKSGQATTQEVADAIIRAIACVGSQVRTIFLSTLPKFLEKDTKALQEFFPNHTIATLGHHVPWDAVRNGLSAKNETAIRASVEMQFWLEANAFVGSRSTMSAMVELLRLVHGSGDVCNRFAQKEWAEKTFNVQIP